jgi:ABC-type nitrate/sulfonate/bicarbonate transport system substrate-binding protein
MAAAKGTTNYAMFEWLAKQQGLDPSTVKVLNTATAGLVGYALANRADAVQLWEPAYTLLMEKKPDLRTLDLHITAQWQKFAGGTHIPYLGVAAHRDWIHQHEDLAAKLYHAYRAAGDWVAAHPTEAAPLIAPKASPADLKAIASLIKDNRRLGMNVEPAGKLENEIKAVYRVGRSLDYLPKEPSADSIYTGAMN